MRLCEKMVERQDAKDAKRRNAKKILRSPVFYLGVIGVLARNNECFPQSRGMPMPRSEAHCLKQSGPRISGAALLG
jgi:hypothetical protein